MEFRLRCKSRRFCFSTLLVIFNLRKKRWFTLLSDRLVYFKAPYEVGDLVPLRVVTGVVVANPLWPRLLPLAFPDPVSSDACVCSAVTLRRSSIIQEKPVGAVIFEPGVKVLSHPRTCVTRTRLAWFGVVYCTCLHIGQVDVMDLETERAHTFTINTGSSIPVILTFDTETPHLSPTTTNTTTPRRHPRSPSMRTLPKLT